MPFLILGAGALLLFVLTQSSSGSHGPQGPTPGPPTPKPKPPSPPPPPPKPAPSWHPIGTPAVLTAGHTYRGSIGMSPLLLVAGAVPAVILGAIHTVSPDATVAGMKVYMPTDQLPADWPREDTFDPTRIHFEFKYTFGLPTTVSSLAAFASLWESSP